MFVHREMHCSYSVDSFPLHTLSTELTCLKFHLDVQEEQLKAGMPASDPNFGVEDASRHGVLSLLEGTGTEETVVSKSYPTVKPATWVKFYAQVAEALAGRGEMPVRPEDAVGLIKLLETVRRSSQVRRTLRFSPE